MYDYGLSTLTQYGIEVKSSSRTRGALVCRTEQGILLLREFHGSEKKLLFQQEVLKKLSQEGCLVDTFIENQEGSLVTRDKDNIPYTLQNWYEGRECDTKSREDIIRSVQILARVHKFMNMPVEKAYMARSLADEYTRHNQEIRKIRKFIRQKGASARFEKEFLGSVQWFLEKGEKALEMLVKSDYEKLRDKAGEEGLLCHGEYNQHNVLILGKNTAVTNFSHWSFDVQMADLYRFMRKILEKYSWDLHLAQKMLSAYDSVRPLSESEWQNLRVRFCYPEKYWKLANHYYTHNKAVISGKNVEKLRTLIHQKKQWEEFSKQCFRQ